MLKKLIKGIFILYLLLLIRLIIFKYPPDYLLEIVREWNPDMVRKGIRTANLVPGKSIRMYIRYFPGLNGFANLIGNILVFLPFGYLLPDVYEACRRFVRLFFISGMFILGVELFQLFSAFGAFDVDDLILNMAGVLAGYGIWILFGKK